MGCGGVWCVVCGEVWCVVWWDVGVIISPCGRRLDEKESLRFGGC